MSTIHILLPVHNRREITACFLDYLIAQDYLDYRLILIDDGSTDGTADMVAERLPDSVILKGDGNCWWAGALQLGYDWLRSHEVANDDLVLMINDDTRFEKAFLRTAIDLLGDKRGVMLHAQCWDEVSNTLVDDGVCIDWRRLKFHKVHDSRQVNCLSTRGLFMRVSDFLSSGGFRPRLFPHYVSDYEFTLRLIDKGMVPLLDPRLKLWTHWYKRKEPVIGPRAAWQSVFSRSNQKDPAAMIAFVLLYCPWPWKPWCLILVFVRTSVRFAKLTLGL